MEAFTDIQILRIILCLAVVIAGVEFYIFVWFFKKGYKNLKLITDATASLLRSEMLHIYNECDRRGWTTPEEIRAFEACYKPYHAFGYNDVGDKLNEALKRLPMQTRLDNS